MSSPVEDITVTCPACRNEFKTWYRASLNMQLDHFDEAYIRSVTIKTCPQCKAKVYLDSLIVGEDGVWRLGVGDDHKRYTLHEAMRIVLADQPEQIASTQFLSDEIARCQFYRQKGGGVAHSGQIRIRAIKYPRLFEIVNRDTVRLVKEGQTRGLDSFPVK